MSSNAMIRFSVLAAILAVTSFAIPASAEQLFVTINDNDNTGAIGQYDAISGAPVNPAFVTGLKGAAGLAVSGPNLYVAKSSPGSIGEYNATTGAPVNPALVTGLAIPLGIAVSEGNLYVADGFEHTIGEYNATTGTPVNPTLVINLQTPVGVAVSGGDLYVTNYDDGTIRVYNATTGTLVNPLLFQVFTPVGIAVSGGSVYVADQLNGRVGEYNATTGAPINPTLVTGLNNPQGIALLGENLFVVNNGVFNGSTYVSLSGSIGVYNATTGAPVNPALVTGLNHPSGITVVPEPSTFTLGVLGNLSLVAFGLRAGRKRRICTTATSDQSLLPHREPPPSE